MGMGDYKAESSRFGQSLYQKVWETARLRLGLEERWYEDTLQVLGEYPPDVQRRLNENEGSSKVFLNLTRPKVKVMKARLADSLFPTDEATWDIEPTPVPRIQKAVDRTADAGKYPLQDQETNRAQQQMKEAEERAKAMHRLIDDQLVESRYVNIGRSVINQGCKLGVGVIKGPIAIDDVRHRWKKDGEQWRSVAERSQADELQPRFKFVNAWDFYPDMHATSMRDCEYVFELHRMTRSELRRHARSGMFDRDTVKHLLDQGYEYRTDPGHFSDNLKWVRLLEQEGDETKIDRFFVFEYWGPITYDDFKMMAEHYGKPDHIKQFEALKDDPLSAIDGRVWFCNDQILRFAANPLPSGRLPYSVFRLDPSENTLLGSHGIPRMLRDQQTSLNAAWRMALESGGLEGVPMFEVDRSRIEPMGGGSDYTIAPRKVFQTKAGQSTRAEDGGPAIRPIPISGDINGLIGLVNISKSFMDDESSIPLIAQGDQAAGSRQTAHGMTLLANAVNVIFREAARGFDDDVTVPTIMRVYEWNMRYSKDDSVKGDMEVKALGSSTLLINEVVSQHIMMLMNLFAGNPDQFPMINLDKLIRLWFKTLRMDRKQLLKTDEELEQLREEAANTPPPPDPTIEGKKELAQMEIEWKREELMIQRDIKVMELVQKGELTMEQIAAGLEKTRIQTQAKERNLLAEAGIKDEHGTGV